MDISTFPGEYILDQPLELKGPINIDIPSISPTNEQQNAINALNLFISNPNQKIFVLQGYAGSGKTTTICHFLTQPKFKKYNIIFSAPTNKAVSVIEHIIADNINNTNIKYKTIHKLFNTKRLINTDGKVLFDFNINNIFEDYHYSNNNITLHNCNLIVIDECSMITNSIYQFIKSCVNRINAKIIFLGDKCQLPPINETISSVFNSNMGFTLYNVVRYKSQLLQFATYIHKSIDTNNNKIKINKFHKDNVILFLNKRKEWLNEYIKMISSNNDPIILAYTNNCVNTINKFIRTKIYSNTYQNRFNSNERIVFNNYYCRNNDKYYTSQCEIINLVSVSKTPLIKFNINILIDINANIINEINPTNYTLLKPTKYFDEPCPICYDDTIDTLQETKCGHKFCMTCISTWIKQKKFCPMCRIKIVNVSGGSSRILILPKSNETLSNYINDFINVIDNAHFDTYVIELQKTQFNNHTRSIIVIKDTLCYNLFIKTATNILFKIRALIINKQISNSKLVTHLLQRLWKYLYCIYIDSFAIIEYGYCITVHKSQGSTYKDVFVDANNIFTNCKKDAINCLYTSITRASNSLFLYYKT